MDVVSKRIVFIIFLFLFTNSLIAKSPIYKGELKLGGKDTLKSAVLGWHFGVNIGMYFANKQSASFYNGSGENSVYRTIIENTFINDEIRRVLHYNFSFDSTLLPKNMKYNPAINFGFLAGFNFQKNAGIIIEFDYSKLKASDYFTLAIDSFNSTSDPSLKKCTITGTEERININIGIHRTFGKLSKTMPYINAGINFNNVKVIDNKIQIENLSYSIVNPTNSYYNIVQGGLGFGVMGGVGLQFILGQSMIVDLGGNIYFSKIKLGTDPRFALHESVYLRFMLRNFGKSEEEN
ncbi:MAG: hypothetical protein HXX09_03245 [Bacteroidetes bacterium]|nr:hypothetical protein [Bacteroidota bacterium]